MSGIWIITQKGDPFLCRAVTAVRRGDILGYLDGGGDFKLGEYATLERAVEVRDAIRRDLIEAVRNQKSSEYFEMPEA